MNPRFAKYISILILNIFIFTILSQFISGDSQYKVSAAPSTFPAFPGAVGYAENVTGGRGGTVCKVTNTNDSGAGSLRNCVENVASPKIVIFETGGLITLLSDINVGSNTTIMGQTAPGGGITIRNDPSNLNSPLDITGNNIIIRGLTLRPGPSTLGSCTLDALHISDSTNVIVDHVSASWATDETMSVYQSQNVTIMNSISSEGLYVSTHSDSCNTAGPFDNHSMGMLADKADNITFYRNFLVHMIDRNPRFSGGTKPGSTATGRIDVINNISYNYQIGHNYTDSDGLIHVNSINNLLKEGLNDKPNHDIRISDNTGNIGVYLTGTILLSTAGSDITGASLTLTNNNPLNIQGSPYSIPYTISTLSTGSVATSVLPDVGNSFGVDCDGDIYTRRDSIDTRLINDYNNGTGDVINNPSDVGGWITPAAGTACTDSDSDGLPDSFETRYFGNLTTTSTSDNDDDGYTNIEEYANGTSPALAASITMSTDGSINFGITGLNTTKDTTATGINDVQTVVAQSGLIDLYIKGTNFSDGDSNNWTLASTNGINQTKLEYSNDGSSWNTITSPNTNFSLKTNVSLSESVNIYLRLTTPTSTSSYSNHSNIITITAVEP